MKNNLKKYMRNCPSCGKELTYSRKDGVRNANKKNSKCNRCSQLGYIQTKEHKLNNSLSNKGRIITQEHRDNLSKTHHKYWLGKTNKGQSERMINRFISDAFRKNSRIGAINYIEQVKLKGGHLYPRYNISSISIIEQKAKELGITDLQHAENGGEYHIKELGYFVDGYSREKNIVIEFYETHHKRYIEKDLIRQKEITNLLKCEFIIIKENGV